MKKLKDGQHIKFGHTNLFPKGVPGIWSPKHLLVAAVDSCLMTTFLAVAENSGLEFVHFESKASGKLEKVDGKYLITEY